MRPTLLLAILLLAGLHKAQAQDNCANAVPLCANSLITRTTVGATTVASDPALSCGDNTVNNSVWFTVRGINAGNCTITVSRIDNNPGLDMQVYTGSCGALVPLGPCASGSSATGGSMSLNFATTAGTVYYIMVDGNGGNQEAFDILATTSNDAITARPDANFNTNPAYGCFPLDVQLQNTTLLHGGTNITYEWKFDTGPFVPGSGADTTVTFNTLGTHTVTLRVCNTECGCKTVSQDIVVQDLYPSISMLPMISCVGTPINFTGDAVVLPDPPFVDPSITSWSWNFGDPGSGANNTASGQNVSHTFTGPGTSFTVTLIAEGTCGPDTVQSTVTLRPPVLVDAGPAQTICEGDALVLTANVSNAIAPITYNWSGPGTLSCINCSTTTITNLAPGGPYTFIIQVSDSFGCTADSSVEITVRPKPTVDAGSDLQLCRYQIVTLNATPLSGTAPFSFNWSPAAGLDDPTLQNPQLTATSPANYCVTVTDSFNCVSDPDCLDITLYPLPSISPSTPVLCATQNPLENTFTVNGAAPGSVYSWALSPDFNLITASNGDSSSVTASFPTGVAASYSFSAIVQDAVTGCTDTISTTFTVVSGLTMQVTGPNQLCLGDSVSLSLSGANTYAWTASPAYTFADSSLATQTVSPTVTTTFTITGTAGACTETINFTLTVNNKPVAVVNPVPDFCGCATITLDGSGSTAGMNYLWTAAGSTLISNPSDLNTPAAACSSDMITLLVTDPASACFADTSITIISRPKPDATAAVTPNLICPGLPALITLDGTGSDANAGTVYHWSSNDPSVLINDTTALITDATVSSSTIFFLTVTDAFGCDSVFSDTVNIQPPPVLSSSNNFVCASDPVQTATLSVTGSSPGSTYNWTGIPACVTPASSTNDSETFDFSSCTPGRYTFTVEVTDAVSGCITTLSRSVTLVTGVNLILSADTTFCEGGTAILTAEGANSYSWSSGQTTDIISAGGLTAASSPYSFTVTGTIGTCTASGTITVNVLPIPQTMPITGSITACQGDTGLSYSVRPVSGNYIWSISGGSITSGQNSNLVLVNWDSSGTGTLSVVDTGSSGCPGIPQTLNVTVFPKPDSSIVISGPNTLCQNSMVTYSVNANPGSSYVWAVTGGTIIGSPNGTSVDVSWASAGPGQLNVYETNSAGCRGPDILLNVSVNPRPFAPTINGIQSVCDSSSEMYYTGFTAGSSYNWIISGGTMDSTTTNGDTLYLTWNVPGLAQVSLSESNSFGCTGDTTHYQVQVNSIPQTLITPDSASICQGQSFQLTATANVSTIQWSSSGSGTFDNVNIASPLYSAGASDTGYVTLFMVASNFPCADDTSRMVLYLSPAPIVSISSTLGTICFGQQDTLRASGGGTYLWQPGGSTDSTLIVSPQVTTSYQVTVSNQFSCSTTASVTITVIPPGIPNAGPDQNLCLGDTLQLNGSQQNAGGVLWSSSGDGTFLPATNVTAVSYIPGTNDTTTGNVQVFLTTTGACLNLTDTVDVMISALPQLDAGPDSTLVNGPDANVSIPLNPIYVNATGITWTSSGSGTFSPSDTVATASYIPSAADFDLDSVILTATTRGGCTVLQDYLVLEFSPIRIPNVFTPYPNTPGYNDFFFIKNLPPNSLLKIWDRWGLLVFESEYYLNNWDANDLQGEVYYYILDTRRKQYKGWVQVIKD